MDRKFPEEYAEDVFNAKAIRAYLPKKTADKLIATIEGGDPLDPAIADAVAAAMRKWAVDRGADHFTHWFQPMNGTTAEKHDAFLDFRNGEPVFAFSGKNLIVGETDASSFPSGGLRSTFEARGYSAWDPTSPAFIKRHSNGATLCIPTAFCSFSGESLDKKTPLLRSMQALSTATRRLMKCFGKKDEHVTITLGAEQEYFLVDRSFYLKRPDLIQAGRTVFGAPPPKHQQLEDHYFGSIRNRILNFMTDAEHELWRLGIPAKTRHNEAAPAQFELAPLFEDVNLACDHNMLIMEVLRQTAERYGLVCLLHEKPFDGVNGSGKHNNWSVSYGDSNLLNPGTDPHQNAIFLTVLCAIIAAVDRHADVLRATVASAGNDHRLGAHEAPPAIMSVYLGDELTKIVDELCGEARGSSRKAGALRIGVDTIPPLPQATSDRNRTSPFAFTSNKFEFRAPGSSQSCAGPCTALNVIVAEAFDAISDELEKLGKKSFRDGLSKVLRDTVRKHKRIIFSGDGYADAWVTEAAKRGLPNSSDTLDAIKCLDNPENIALFEKYKVYSAREIASRREIYADVYAQRIRIERGVALDIASSMVMPVAQNEYSAAVLALKNAQKADVAPGTVALRKRAEKLGDLLDGLSSAIATLESAETPSASLGAMARLRGCVDSLEYIVTDSAWPLPKYSSMLFLY